MMTRAARNALAVLLTFAGAQAVLSRLYSKNEVCFNGRANDDLIDERIQGNRHRVFAKELVKRMKGILESYHRPWFLPTGLLQTVMTEFILQHPDIPFRREEIQLPAMKKPEGAICCPEVVPEGIVSIDWLDQGLNKSAAIVILIPGLTGSSKAGYIRRSAKILHERGFRVACFNPRGRGENPLASPMLYSVGYTEDLRRVVEHIRALNSESSNLFAAGFSLGSNYLGKFLGEEGVDCALDGAICLACPVDCLSISFALQTEHPGKLLDPFLVSFVKKVASEHQNVLETAKHIFDFEKMHLAETMHEFDGAMVARAFGFRTASDYYRWSSCGLVLNKIATPTLFLVAENDPVCPGSRIFPDSFEENPFLVLCRTPNGGHSMDWPVMKGFGLESWSVNVMAAFFDKLLH